MRSFYHTTNTTTTTTTIIIIIFYADRHCRKMAYLFFVTSHLPLWAQGSPVLALGVRQRLLALNSRVEWVLYAPY
jgi:hypothetical protein